MSRKLKFKIISCSSEEQEFPVSSLLFNGSEGWQTRRFCVYPQEITIEFYGLVNIKKIQLVSDHRKISSQVDILYYLPITHQEQRFYKYGYLQFNRPDSSNLRQIKTIMVDINCLYLRFLFHKPYPSKENFFSQIGLAALSIYGLDQPQSMIQNESNSEVEDNQEGINEQDEKYIQQKVQMISAQKDRAIAQQDYQNANYYKNILNLIEQTKTKLRQKRRTIIRALQNQDYETARSIKIQIDRQKEEINSILLDKSENHSQLQMQQELNENEFADLNKPEEPAQNEFMENPREINIRNQSSKVHQKIVKSRVEDNYDQRVIPTINKNGRNNTEINELQDQKPKPLPQVEQVEGKYIKDATVMQQYFDQETVKKFFSTHWQHNLDSLILIQKAIGTKPKESGLIKCLITIVKYSSRQSNFQVGIQCLNVFKQLLRINNESHALSKPGQSQNDLDEIGKQIVKKLADNNAKTKQAAEQCFGLMVNSLLFGVQTSSLLLSKTKSKLTSKQIITRLHLLSNMIQDHGIGSGNSVPLTCLQFAIEHCSNPGEQVRKTAIQLLRSAYKKDPAKTQIKLIALKQSVQQQIKDGEKMDTPVKNKKKL